MRRRSVLLSISVREEFPMCLLYQSKGFLHWLGGLLCRADVPAIVGADGLLYQSEHFMHRLEDFLFRPEDLHRPVSRPVGLLSVGQRTSCINKRVFCVGQRAPVSAEGLLCRQEDLLCRQEGLLYRLEVLMCGREGSCIKGPPVSTRGYR